MNTVHKITDGAGNVFGWAVLENRCKEVGRFETVQEACAVADKADALAALKLSKQYSKTAVEVVMADTGFATEYEAAMALFACGWDVDAAVNRLLFA